MPVQPQPDRRKPGILCPDCGEKLYTKRVKPRRDNSVRRKRVCRGCGFSLVTFERPAAAAGRAPSS